MYNPNKIYVSQRKGQSFQISFYSSVGMLARSLLTWKFQLPLREMTTGSSPYGPLWCRRAVIWAGAQEQDCGEAVATRVWQPQEPWAPAAYHPEMRHVGKVHKWNGRVALVWAFSGGRGWQYPSLLGGPVDGAWISLFLAFFFILVICFCYF